MAAFATRSKRWTGEADGTARPWRPTPPDAAGRRGASLARAAGFAGAALGELLWTTRCIICDAPGATLCGDCLMRLPYIDRWRACPRCGAPDGMLQCTECNTFTLGELERERPPFDACVNALEHRGDARRIVTGYKDAGERRLAGDIAGILRRAMPRSWTAEAPVLTYIPADRKALRRRGFDHMEPIARELAGGLGLPLGRLLRKDAVDDQRGLTRRQRFENMAGSISLDAGMHAAPGNVVVVDDVHTTGATLFAACDALRAGGAGRVRCITLARVA